MIATTPSGTRTRVIRRPFGGVHPSSTSPTGSTRSATVRSPPAMLSSRASVSRRRSSGPAASPPACAASRSASFAAWISAARSASSSAAVSSAAFFAAVGAEARMRDAARARCPSSSTLVIRSGYSLTGRSSQGERGPCPASATGCVAWRHGREGHDQGRASGDRRPRYRRHDRTGRAVLATRHVGIDRRGRHDRQRDRR